MIRSVRAALAGSAAIVAAATLLAVPAEAATHLPDNQCSAPQGQFCLAVHNRSARDAYGLYSFRAPNGTCMTYKGDWGPGDTVGWDVHVADEKYPRIKAYRKTACAGDSQSGTSQNPSYHQGRYLVVSITGEKAS
ncbi:hypothetical protein JNUCC0626_47835 [Lentzea sp. JNUCC 0626]|uniref:hypothetical protein n=1 Tax=Lentzea sp. JNUCC 0626 TaxID=3367513 RepID=UPI0037488969